MSTVGWYRYVCPPSRALFSWSFIFHLHNWQLSVVFKAITVAYHTWFPIAHAKYNTTTTWGYWIQRDQFDLFFVCFLQWCNNNEIHLNSHYCYRSYIKLTFCQSFYLTSRSFKEVIYKTSTGAFLPSNVFCSAWKQPSKTCYGHQTDSYISPNEQIQTTQFKLASLKRST